MYGDVDWIHLAQDRV